MVDCRALGHLAVLDGRQRIVMIVWGNNARVAADRHGLQMVRCDREYRAELDVGRMAGADLTGADRRTDRVTGAAFRLIRDREAVRAIRWREERRCPRRSSRAGRPRPSVMVNESRRWRLMSSDTESGPFRVGMPEEAIGGFRAYRRDTAAH
jgi:hypothetical protein